jgi:hypothetical protein
VDEADAQASSPLVVTPNPLVSRGQATFASPDVSSPGSVVNGQYCEWPGWRSASFPTWVAMHLDSAPTQVLLSWDSGYTGDYMTAAGAPSYGIPRDYVIETSAHTTNGADGSWQTVVSIQGNQARTRAHTFSLAGAQWVRMTVTAVISGTVDNTLAIDEIDVHDASAGTSDTVFFMGDSITVAAHLRCQPTQPSFAESIHSAFPAYFPAMIDGGVGGVNSAFGASVVDAWLALNPDYHIWAIAYGTNDAWQSMPPEVFAQHLQSIIDSLSNAGREPVLARIPWARSGPTDSNIVALNQVIDSLTQ